MDQYRVIGNPVSHSKSPKIHAYFAKQTNQSLNYSTLLGDEETFEQQVKTFFVEGGKGLNVTVPFKERAFSMCQSLSIRAQQAGAVNTLMLNENNELHGDNTDGAGLVGDIIQINKKVLTNKRVLVIGAGGAVRGILEPLLSENPKSVTIVNRTIKKAETLAHHFGCSSASFADLKDPFDIIINGTSASLSGNLPPLHSALIGINTWCYDMMYGKQPTVFLQWAYGLGAQGADGLGMLVGQAAESFFLWRGVRPDINDLIKEMRSVL